MKPALISLFALATLTGCALSNADAETDQNDFGCTLASEDSSTLEQWREDGFAAQQTDEGVRDFATCLEHPDPFLRDKIGYEGLTAALRSGNISELVRRDLMSDLSESLFSDDADGFRAPFAALALAELVRSDRIEPFLTSAERQNVAEAAAIYLSNVTDYRAFSDDEGWRHGVAHGADVAMQLALNPNVETGSLEALRLAVTQQVTARSGHAFTHGEPERLARPVFFMATREAFAPEDWTTWFETLADPAPLSNWGEAYQSETDLARLHNLKAFARVLYINASLSENEALQPLSDGAIDLLKALP